MLSREQLLALVQQGDTELDPILTAWADRLEKEANSEGEGVATVASLFKQVHLAERLTPDVIDHLLQGGLLDQSIADFFVQRNKVPDLPWISADKIVAGGEFFRERGLMTFVGLAFASLPACYCWDTEARVLSTTGRLSQPGRIPRRIPETAQFVLDIGTQDAFEPDGVGIQAANKIRLMHACIRYMLLRDPAAASVDPNRNRLQPWDEPRFGPPISQAFLTATLLTFHQIILASLKKLSLRIDEDQAQAYIHRWNVAGYFIGVAPDVLEQLATQMQTEHVESLVMEEWRKKTVSGQDLSRTLIHYIRNNIIEGVTFGIWNPMVVVPAVLTRYLSGKETSNALNLKLTLLQKLAYLPVVLFTRIVGFLDNFGLFRRMTVALTRFATTHLWGFVQHEQQEHPDATAGMSRYRGVAVPAEFTEQWGMKLPLASVEAVSESD